MTRQRLCFGLLALVAVLCTAPGTAQSPAGDTESLRLRRTPVVAVFDTCKDSVVNISATQVVEDVSPMGLGQLFGELFDLPNGRPFVRRYKQTSVGSGFVLHSAGYIVTNAHVVALTAERKVIFADQREFEAQVVAIDNERDLAVLKIDSPQPLQPMKLGRSSDLMVGETVIAIGNPLGYQHTVTAGVISALGRTIEANNEVRFKDLIQTDASINPGNSGGPLCNVLGELIGINTAIRGDAQNIGFAIPVDHLREMLPALLDVERRYRIVVGLEISNDNRSQVLALKEGSPAHVAGLAVGDRITRVDGQAIGSGIDFLIALVGRQEGDQLRLRLERNGEPHETILTLGGRAKPDGDKLLHHLFGMRAAVLTPENAAEIGLPRLRGLVVIAVDPGSPAEAAGIRRGDIIDHLGRYQAAALDEVGQLLETVRSGDAVRISVLRVSRRGILRSSILLRAR